MSDDRSPEEDPWLAVEVMRSRIEQYEQAERYVRAISDGYLLLSDLPAGYAAQLRELSLYYGNTGRPQMSSLMRSFAEAVEEFGEPPSRS